MHGDPEQFTQSSGHTTVLHRSISHTYRLPLRLQGFRDPHLQLLFPAGRAGRPDPARRADRVVPAPRPPPALPGSQEGRGGPLDQTDRRDRRDRLVRVDPARRGHL